MTDLDGILASFELTALGEGRFTAPNAPGGQGVIFGGQLLGQTIVAARATAADKTVKTVHTLFARSGKPDQDVEIVVDEVHTGRTAAARGVRIGQGTRTCTTSTVLLTADEDDFIHHADAMPDVAGPESCRPVDHLSGWDIRIVGDVDVNDPAATGPAELAVWTRFPDAPEHVGMDGPLLAYASDGFLIGAAVRPHAGVGQSQAHVSLATGVLTHTLTFHEPFSVRDWLLLVHRVPHTGAGRSFGRAEVFTREGRLVASFSQDAMIRPIPGPPQQ